MLKKLLLIFLGLYCSTFTLSGQQVFEQILNKSKEFKEFWTIEKGSIDFTLYKIYDIGQTDTTYEFVISVANKKLEQKGYSSSVGFAVGSRGGSASAFSSSSISEVEDLKNECALKLDSLMMFLEYANDIFVYAQEKHGNPVTATRSIKNITIVTSISGNSATDRKYFFRIGEAAYSLSESDFVEMIQSASKARDMIQRAP